MKIYGLQKLTLLDFPHKTACTVFTGGCNFACPFCHNASLVTHIDGEQISDEEIFSFLEKRKNILEGVCITGGEPLCQHDIEDFILRIKKMGLAVKLDTNGSYPEKLKSLIDKNLLDYVAMDIKNCIDKYSFTAGVSVDTDKIQQSVNILMNGALPYEFRTTVVEELHTQHDFEKIAEWLSGAKEYYLQTFVSSPDTIAENLSAPNSETMAKYQKILKNKIKFVSIRK